MKKTKNNKKNNRLIIAGFIGAAVVLLVVIGSMVSSLGASEVTTTIAKKNSSSTCQEAGRDIAKPVNAFNLADVAALEKDYLNGAAGKDINGDGNFSYADIISLLQCNLCKWNWKNCGSEGEEEDDTSSDKVKNENNEKKNGKDDKKGDSAKGEAYFTVVSNKDALVGLNRTITIKVTDLDTIKELRTYINPNILDREQQLKYWKHGIRIKGKVVKERTHMGQAVSFYLEPNSVVRGGNASCDASLEEVRTQFSSVGTSKFLPDGVWCPRVRVLQEIKGKQVNKQAILLGIDFSAQNNNYGGGTYTSDGIYYGGEGGGGGTGGAGDGIGGDGPGAGGVGGGSDGGGFDGDGPGGSI